MITVLSPAKNLNEDPQSHKIITHPRLLDQSAQLINKLQKLTTPKIRKLMSISAPLALLNKKRYQDFNIDHDTENSAPAIFTFNGDVYRGLEASNLNRESLLYAEGHLRILSGLYGLLRPFDLIQPYRLEMGTQLPIGRKKNLYDFWGTRITDLLHEDAISTNSDFIFNLASDEYWKAVKTDELDIPVIKANFKELRNGAYKFISFSAKVARGQMARYVIENKIEDIEGIKTFDLDNYQFNEELSSENSLIFTRE